MDKTQTKNPAGLPYGTGSIQMRGRVWWLIYKDETGRKIQANSGTDDQAAARRMLAVRAIKTLRARLAALRAVLHESRGEARADAGTTGRQRAHRTTTAADARGRKSNSQGGSR
jgi:hypothetical protein